MTIHDGIDPINDTRYSIRSNCPTATLGVPHDSLLDMVDAGLFKS
jgi:hypothetical protein